MNARLRRTCAALALVLLLGSPVFGSAYNAHPKLIVILIVDQMRGDFLSRWQNDFGDGGFRLLTEHGAVFTDCNYDYASTHTSPGHSSIMSGAYVNGHGVVSNSWWDPAKKKIVGSVEDERYPAVGLAQGASEQAYSPKNLLATTLGDEMKLATGGKSRVFALSIKGYAAVLSGGHAADAAYWVDPKSGAWLTSSIYRKDLPKWVEEFNSTKGPQRVLGREWKDAAGKNSYPGAKTIEDIAYTPYSNEYELDFARSLVVNEKLGTGPATDLLVISISATDFLGHKVGPDDPQLEAMYSQLDRQLADFFSFLGKQFGLTDVWIGLSADHGVSPTTAVSRAQRFPAPTVDTKTARAQANAELSSRLTPGRTTEFIRAIDWPLAFLDPDAFAAAKLNEADAERAAGEALAKAAAWQGFVTRAQLVSGDLPRDESARRYTHSLSTEAGWYVIGEPPVFELISTTGTTHATAYTYDTHVPLVLFGLPFKPGVYRTHAEPVDMAPTFASLLEINAPSHATGRVLVEALAPAREPSPKESAR
jgi:arylsulfatase A-like enzyme